MLYLVPTPIGNLEDITLRALKVLELVDYILCEDTRKSSILLKHYKIQKSLVSFHKFNEKHEENRVISDLKNGKNIALISDAGSPLISDPGSLLIKRCVEENIPYTALAGACSPILALMLSGCDTTSFAFFGFLSKKEGEIKKKLKHSFLFEGSSIFFESPQRLIKTLSFLKEIDPEATVFVAREMTKMFEEHLKGTPQTLIDHFSKKPIKGEIVLIIEGKKPSMEEMDPQELISHLQIEKGLSLKEAIKEVVKLTGVNKNKLYRDSHVIS